MLFIDGAQGEGGGQVLRTALALSLATRTPFRMTRIRAGRRLPGLRRQHLAAVRAAAAVGKATVSGDAVGSLELSFAPTGVETGRYVFDVGSSGSTTLVAQTVLPALAQAVGPSTLRIVGGTHNPLAPTFEFFALAYLALLARMGPRVTATLVRPGFVPRGGGVLELRVQPAPLRPIALLERGAIVHRRARAVVAGLPRTIAEREVRVSRQILGWPADCFGIEEFDVSFGPGNFVTLEVGCEHVTEVFTGIGQRGLPAEVVAERAASEARTWIDTGVPVGPHLADQLVLPMALSGAGAFRTGVLTAHTRTQIEVVRTFIELPITVEPETGRSFRIEIGGNAARATRAEGSKRNP